MKFGSVPGGTWSACLLAVLFCGCGQRGEELGRFRTVADFELTERSGRTVRRADLRGKILVVNFFFSGCSAQCLALSSRMSEVEYLTARDVDVVLLSLSVDPRTDTPETLARYARTFTSNTNRWLFLTGEKQKIYPLIKESFLLPVAESEEARRALDGAFIHSDKIALVDATGVVRAYYDGMDAEAPKKIALGIARLHREPVRR